MRHYACPCFLVDLQQVGYVKLDIALQLSFKIKRRKMNRAQARLGAKALK